jgi:hypothetical protein
MIGVRFRNQELIKNNHIFKPLNTESSDNKAKANNVYSNDNYNF